MNIRYINGESFEAVLLSRTDTTMRLAIQGHDDIVALNRVNDTWITDDCEPVQVDFSWATAPDAAAVTEDDCLCSHELAAHLIHMLYAGDNEVETHAHPMPRTQLAAALCHVV